jgi:hypothetical protein
MTKENSISMSNAPGAWILVALFAALAGWALLSRPASDGCRSQGPEGGGCLFPERVAGKYGYVDETGEVVIPARFDGADTFSEGLAVVLDSGRFGYIDARGDLAIPAVYRHARAFQGGFAVVRAADRWLMIDRAGKAYPCSLTPAATPVAAAAQ